MSETHARSILESVAAGVISPAEAAVLLDALPDRGGPEAGTNDETVELDSERFESPAAGEPTRVMPGASDAPPVRKRVFADLRGGPINIVCEPGTDVPHADGPAFFTGTADTELGYYIDAQLGDDSVIVVPSDIDLKIDARGADFSLSGIDGTVSAELNVGGILVEGRFVDGESRIEARAGDVELRLQPGSDVEVISNSPASIYVDGLEHTGRGRWSLGAGTAKFEIGGHLGSITISAL